MSPGPTAAAVRAASGFDGVVLCGGRSRRMGTDKSLIEIAGVPMARRVADALTAAGAERVAAIGGDVESLRGCGLDVHPDQWPGEGPLGAVLQSLRTVGSQPSVVVLSCDLLEPDSALIAALAARCLRVEVDLVVPVTGGRPQWTHGAWRRSAVPALADAFSSGERSVAGASRSLRVDRCEVTAATGLADADVPSDLASGRGHP